MPYRDSLLSPPHALRDLGIVYFIDKHTILLNKLHFVLISQNYNFFHTSNIYANVCDSGVFFCQKKIKNNRFLY